MCGWDTAVAVPDETIFSRAFAEFAKTAFGQTAHAALIEKTQRQRLAGHISRDASAIEGREKPTPKPKAETAPQPKRRRKAGEPKPLEQMTRVERQFLGMMTLEQMIAELPRACDVGCKTNSAGHKCWWVGYKLHLDVADGQIPISCLLTSASVHDSQAAIPLAEMTARRVTNLYDLMDRGYESDLIQQHSEKLGHVPIIDRQKRAFGQGGDGAPSRDAVSRADGGRAGLRPAKRRSRRANGARARRRQSDGPLDVWHFGTHRRSTPPIGSAYVKAAESTTRAATRRERCGRASNLH